MTIFRSSAYFVTLSIFGLGVLGCEEEKPKPVQAAEVKKAEPAPEPVIESPPHLVISESGPSVRGMSVMVEQKSGKITGLDKLKTYLGDEKRFIDGQELNVLIDRKAKQGWVSPYLKALSDLGAAKITVKTETRSDFPAELEFVSAEKAASSIPCTLVGGITDDNETAIWRVSGGAARKRHKGLGGPDLSMTAETITDMAKTCDSDLIFVSGSSDATEWGFVYDLAASAIDNPEAKLKRASLPNEPAVAGTKLKL